MRPSLFSEVRVWLRSRPRARRPFRPVSVGQNPSSQTRRTQRTLFCAAVIVLLLGALVTLATSLALAATRFPDVDSNHPYFRAIEELAAANIISGKPDGKFYPDDPVTRQQFAKMIVLTCDYPVSEADVCPFSDVEISGPGNLYPDNYIAVCAKKGITLGKTANSFDPYSNITRYQVISMVVRAAKNLELPLGIPPSGWHGRAGWESDPTHGMNAARAEYNGLLAGLDLDALNPRGNMSRGEVAQVLFNLLDLMGGVGETTTTTTSTSSTTTTSTSSTTTTTAASYSLVTEVYPSGAGTVTRNPNRSSYTPGTRVTLTATPAPGYVFDHWSGSVTGSTNPATFNINTNMNVTAVFTSLRWEDLGALPSGSYIYTAPAVCSWATGRLDVFVFGNNNRGRPELWHKLYQNSWSAWENLGEFGSDRTFVYAPAAVSWGERRIDVFATTVDSQGSHPRVYHRYFSGDRWSTSWEALGDKLWWQTNTGPEVFYYGRPSSSPAAASWGPNRLDVFVNGKTPDLSEHFLSHCWYDGGWYPTTIYWETLGQDNKGFSSPAAVSWGVGRLDVFEIGRSQPDQPPTLQQMWFERGLGGWHGWVNLGKPSGDAQLWYPAAASWGTGHLDVFALASMPGGAWTVFLKTYDSGSWHDWIDLGDYLGGTTKIASAPAAVSWGPNRIDVFVVGSNKHLYHKWFDGSTWRP